MSNFRLLDLVKSFVPLLPEVETPYQKVSFDERVLYTMGAGFFFFLAQIPIQGVKAVADPYPFLRPIFAMGPSGSLLEFGVAPVVSAGLLFQVLAGLQLLDVNFDLRSDRELFQSAQKLFALLLTFIYSVALVAGGYYGDVATLGGAAAALAVVQLFVTGLFVVLVCEVLEKGYGFGSGPFLFIVIHVAEQFVSNTFSLQSLATSGRTEFAGALPALFSLLRHRKSVGGAVWEAFTRGYGPNLSLVYVSLAVLAVTLYFQSTRLDLSLRSNRVRTTSTVFPVRLFYTGALPLLAYCAQLFNVLIVSYTLSALFPGNFLVRLLGSWKLEPLSRRYEVSSGVLFYVTPSHGLVDSVLHPLKAVVYAAVFLYSAVAFAAVWVEISGAAPRDMAKTFKEQGVVLAGHRDVAVVKELKKVIPPAATTGALVSAAIAVAADLLFGTDGMGVALVTAVGIVFYFMEVFAQEAQSGGITGEFAKYMGGATA